MFSRLRVLTTKTHSFSLPKFGIPSNRNLSIVTYDNEHITVDLGPQSDPIPEVTEVTEDSKTSAESLAESSDSLVVAFSTVFLRDSCRSETSVDPSTLQKSFTTASIATGLTIAEPPAVITSKNRQFLQVKWRHRDGTVCESKFDEQFLRKARKPETRFQGKFFHSDRKFWTNRDLVQDSRSLTVGYHAYLEGSGSFKKALSALNKYGICFVNNIDDPLRNPETVILKESNAQLWPVAKLALKFGYVKPTFYGTLFDVKNEKNAKNIANTDVFLPLHMDLCYYESPPGLQLLHFIQNSTIGGENVFADSFLAARHVKETDPEAYEALKTVPITFHYDNNGEYYYYLRPLVVEDPFLRDPILGEPELKEVNYSPPFQGPLELTVTKDDNPDLFKAFLRGMVAFEEFVNDSTNQYVLKMPENTCVIFDNRRVLHSRLAFSDSNGGDRWLMGCYVDGDSFRSRLRTYNRDDQ